MRFSYWAQVKKPLTDEEVQKALTTTPLDVVEEADAALEEDASLVDQVLADDASVSTSARVRCMF